MTLYDTVKQTMANAIQQKFTLKMCFQVIRGNQVYKDQEVKPDYLDHKDKWVLPENGVSLARLDQEGTVANLDPLDHLDLKDLLDLKDPVVFQD